MHAPDNYLSPATCAAMGAAMVPVWAISARKVAAEVSRARIPLLGIGAAFSFLIMMFNVPLPGGTTGHAVGAALLAVALGPWAACISITIALLVQALLFGDGGILVFPANCFNIAFVAPFLGHFVYRAVSRCVGGDRGRAWGLAAGSYVGLNMAALCTAVLFGIQPLLFRTADGRPMYCPYPLSVSVPAMLLPHLAVAGVVDAIFATAIAAFLGKVAPALMDDSAAVPMPRLYGLLVALILLTPAGLLAAGAAWGEWGAGEMAKTLGFVPEGMQKGFALEAVLPDYSLRGVPDVVGYVTCGFAGAAILVIAFKLFSLLKRNGRSNNGS